MAARPNAPSLAKAPPNSISPTLTLIGMSQASRDDLVVTSETGDDGRQHVVSVFGDGVWELSPVVRTHNVHASHVRIVWPDDIPRALIDDAKAALYCALRQGRRHRPWKGKTVAAAGRNGIATLKYLAFRGARSFADVRAIHLSDFIADQRQLLQPKCVAAKLEVVDLVWSFPNEVLHPLPEHPWSGSTLPRACGSGTEVSRTASQTGKTPVIPRSALIAIFEFAETVVAEAARKLKESGLDDFNPRSFWFTQFKCAVLFLLQISSGMRNSEAVAVTSDCWRTEVRNGVQLHWVRTQEFKGSRGLVDFLVPKEAIDALELLQKYAKTLQTRLTEEASWLKRQLELVERKGKRMKNSMSTVAAVQRLNHIADINHRLFLTIDPFTSDHLGNGSRVVVMSLLTSNLQLKALARASGSDWPLANHQCRRTFAYNVANSRLGRMGLVFLKWQLKHASLSWTQLYASNPNQDAALYIELDDEAVKARVDLLEGWMHLDAPLSGGAGRKIMMTRTTPVSDFKELLLHTAESVELRSTGHAWCLSGTRGCDGQGVYDPTMCGGCSQAVIDRDQAITWQMIHLDNLRLAAITDCGPAAEQKARRAVERSREVLQDLGVPVPTVETISAS
jgi:hypothetical protein